MDVVNTKDEITANLLVFDSYRTSNRKEYRSFFTERLRLGKIFVVGLINDNHIFCPSRFAGYKECTMEKHKAFPSKDGRITTPIISKLLKSNAIANEEAEKSYEYLCHELSITPSKKARTYWILDLPNGILPFSPIQGDTDYPDEVTQYIEGVTKRVCVNRYERNEEARSACLKHYGFNCVVCDFNFESKFGLLGQRFIHVHHLVPISSCGQEYTVNPVDDLRPVCPNCHAMLHKSDPPFSIEELKELIMSQYNHLGVR